MSKKGQALVEFIIILPILIMIILGIIDYSLIISKSNKLESKMEDVITMYKDGKTTNEMENYLNKDDKNIRVIINEEKKYTQIVLNGRMDLITPGLGAVIGNPYKVIVKRTILYEK